MSRGPQRLSGALQVRWGGRLSGHGVNCKLHLLLQGLLFMELPPYISAQSGALIGSLDNLIKQSAELLTASLLGGIALFFGAAYHCFQNYCPLMSCVIVDLVGL